MDRGPGEGTQRGVPPPPPPPAPPLRLGGSEPLRPVAAAERQPILDALRGFALLGILLINIQLMRGPAIYAALAGTEPVDVASRADQVTAAVLGLLVSGKFMASFSLLFGIGAALIAERSAARGHAPRGVLGRRYGWLLLFGLAHMFLLFPGDILFLYGLSGLVLLAFVNVRPTIAAAWGGGIIGVVTAATAGLSALGTALSQGLDVSDDPFVTSLADFAAARADQAVAAFTSGSYLDVLVVNAWQVLLVQSSQLFALPLTVALFLLGFAVGRAGWVRDPAAHLSQLRRLAVVGLLVGLPLNVGAALSGPLGIDGPAGAAATTDVGVVVLVALAQLLGAPLLAIGYLATLTLLWTQRGAPRRLAALGRVALSGYLLQSLLALIVFAGFSLYGQLGTLSSLGVVAGIWAVLLLVAPLWVDRIGQGPAERLWRRLTYGTPGAGS